jgi:hypothetical protein
VVEIPESLIKRLQGLGPHFCLVEGKNPNVGGKSWQLAENLMFADDPKLQAWVNKGRNYGIVCGYGLTVIEADHEKIKQAVEEKLPPTFAVLSPGHKTPHYYFLCSMEDCTPLIDPDNKGENIGHIKAQGGMVVGPGSIHPDTGTKYEILYDRDLAQVTPQQVREALRAYMVPSKQINRVETAARLEKQETNVDLNILGVVPLAGLRRQGSEFFGPHPVHGSEGGRNFWVSSVKNCWYCFRCGSGGGPLLWIAVEEGIINCADAGPGALRGEVFKRVLQKAVERGLIEETQVNVKERGEGTSLGDYALRLVGSKAVFFNQNGKPILSYPASNIDGMRVKKEISKKLKIDELVVDEALAGFMLNLQQPKPAALTLEEKASKEPVEKAEKLLKDPKLIVHIVQALRELRLVGETRNALSTFFDMLSAMTEWPINRRWSGRSGMGKTTIVMKVAELFPPEMVMVLSGATKKTLWYHPDAEEVDEYTREMNLKGKVIIILEESESKEFLDEVKPLLSHDKHELEYAFVEKVGGVNVTRKMILRGWPVYIGITTEAELREEQQTRALLGTPDYGKDKYRAVIAADALKTAMPWAVKRTDLPQVIQEAIRQLKPCKVWIPWLPVVAALFPYEEPKSMREWPFFRSFLEAITLLYQRQIPRVKVNGTEYYASPSTILEIASEIGKAGFEETLSKLPRDVREYAAYLAEHKKDFWTYRELQKEYGKCFGGSISLTTLKDRYVKKLVDEGLLEIDDSEKPYKIKLVEERSTPLTVFEKSLEIIRSGEIMRELIQKTSSTGRGSVKELEAVSPDGGPLSLDELIHNLTQPLPVDDVKKAISRTKDEEYALPSLFLKSVEDVEAFSQKNQKNKNTEPQDNLALKPKDIARVASELSAQTSPENTLKSEFLPRSLRVPPGLEEYMETVRLGKEWVVQCQLCKEAGKQFFTANAEDMMLHIQRIHKGLNSGEYEWEGFHAVGYMATPSKNWRKTVEAIDYFKRLEGRFPNRQELQEALKHFWTEDSIPKVLEKLKKKGIVDVTLTDFTITKELVFKAMRELTQNKPYATTQELLSETKLTKEVLLKVLDDFQRDGKLTQFRPDFWRLAT